MMLPSNIVIFHLSITVLLLNTFTMATDIPQATESEILHSSDDERFAISASSDDHHNHDNFRIPSKSFNFVDDDSRSEEEYDNDDFPVDHYEAFQPQIFSKRYATKVTRGGNANGDNRLWAIPYRFGRAAMPYRFGKRAAMPYRFGKRAGMHFRLGKKSASL